MTELERRLQELWAEHVILKPVTEPFINLLTAAAAIGAEVEREECVGLCERVRKTELEGRSRDSVLIALAGLELNIRARGGS